MNTDEGSDIRMAQPRRVPQWFALTRALFESAKFSRALSLCIVGVAFLTTAIRDVIGWPGLIGVLGALVVLAAGSFIAHWPAIEWHGLLPVSLLLFVGWCAVSVIWSVYQWATLAAVLYQVLFAFLAVYLALVRDAIQIVRVIGDVLRVLLTASLALEVLSGLLIDMPIKFLGIAGNLAHGGPISGLFGSRNQLGLVALIAAVTFIIEWRTKSVSLLMASFSVLVAALCLVFSSSPVIAIMLVIVVLASAALFGLRHIRSERWRFYVQIVLGVFSTAVAVLAFIFRAPIIDLLHGESVITVRYDVWIQIWHLIPTNPLLGWGWIGFWRGSLPPYSLINAATGAPHANGLNAFLDVWLQVGLVGFLLFLLLLGLAMFRSWLLGSNKRSVIYAWPPLVLIALIGTAMAESTILYDGGWMLLVICTVKASQGMSWRQALPAAPEPTDAG
ncbi:O-antigen ligase [Humibacter sp. RRB41]|uniref:O-antigen ligase family protein n=1 Tax=Humibacter sp. RRB41 TaxID=2919946 RepID=UPI001FAA6D45|nr:exopolysaccharide production protein [Humibacter sp. RRB41]